ncbi:Spo0E family sporulation regulatory protein-aspartic acid phosphatase [Paenisporosarcina sp. TG20]|uniref:aspartyl-phosphate phosphatase Spo0E family protein n=1 Tax=Paenisporosarcina sp. TG20 TaxID=1211706 RepID=UPI0003743F2C
MKVVLVRYILLVKIDLKRREMYNKAKLYTLTHPRVITCSQELDTLLNKYHVLIFQDKYDHLYKSSFYLAPSKTEEAS